MPIDWSDKIVLVDLANEPEFSEEMSALFARVNLPPMIPRITDGSVSSAEASLAAGARSGSSVPAAVPDIVLNFAAVSYLNSSHLAALLRLRKRVTEGRRQLVVCGLNDELSTVMRHTGLDQIFFVAPDTVTALAHVQIEHERSSGGGLERPGDDAP